MAWRAKNNFKRKKYIEPKGNANYNKVNEKDDNLPSKFKATKVRQRWGEDQPLEWKREVWESLASKEPWIKEKDKDLRGNNLFTLMSSTY